MPPAHDILGYCAAVLSTVSFVPQVIKVVRSGETEDLSLGMFVCTALALTMWCAYGIWTGAVPLAVANGLTALLATVILAVKLRNDLAKRRRTRGSRPLTAAWSRTPRGCGRRRRRRQPTCLRLGANEPRLAPFATDGMVRGTERRP